MEDAPTSLADELAAFLEEWNSPGETMRVQTSGSTGTPKELLVSKDAMRASARLSCEAFGLRPGDTALLCLPLRYIAGKMMVVRFLVGGLALRLVEPCSHPFRALAEPVNFAPIVPMQAIRTLEDADGVAQLSRARTILLGGGFIDPALEDALQAVPSRVFASYGMTETLSHIALRTVNGPDRSAAYTPLPGVEVSLSAEGTLCLRVPHLGISHMETNDLAELDENGHFRILGRRDAVINSGGVKIQAEKIEQALRAATGLTVLVLPAPHPQLGQCVALLWEGDTSRAGELAAACDALPRYHRPRIIRHLPILPRTDTGKISRAAALAQLSLNP